MDDKFFPPSHRSPRRSLGLLPTVCLLVWVGLACMSSGAAAGDQPLTVVDDPAGGLRATASFRLPGPPSLVQQVLTDYEHWPQLFGVAMRLARIERRPDRVVTELYIEHPILPSERRLVCESVVPPGGGLVTKLREGDFTRYERTWAFAAEANGAATRATFDLVVEVQTLAPDWLVAVELKRQLERHFRILRETVAARAAAH